MQITSRADSVNKFLQIIFERKKQAYITCYRGQSNRRWSIKPSVMRGLRANAERQILSELLAEAPAEFHNDRLMFDKLVRAQHYGLPTRLLDVTLNPLVALFFACYEDTPNESTEKVNDGVVHSFYISQERERFADSDTISLICNLARTTDAEKEEMRKFIKAPEGSPSEMIENFQKLDSAKRLIQFVRTEKPYFTNDVNPRHLLKYYFIHPNKNNRRIIAQSGAFIAAGLLAYKSPGENNNGFTTDKIIIPSDAKATILEELDALNVNSRAMFPETESAAGYIKKKWQLA